MPKKGQYASQCAYGHDLTQPGARRPPRENRRGLGECRQCVIDRRRAQRGSTKTGAINRFRVNDERREQALRDGLHWCVACETGKEATEFNRDSGSPSGLSFYCRDCRKAQKRAAYYRDAERARLLRQAAAFGISPDDVLRMRDAQGGLCAICKQKCQSGRALAIDHCHATGKVRALLCANCNNGLGRFKDDPARLAEAARYLLRWRQEHAQSVEGVQHAGL